MKSSFPGGDTTLSVVETLSRRLPRHFYKGLSVQEHFKDKHYVLHGHYGDPSWQLLTWRVESQNQSTLNFCHILWIFRRVCGMNRVAGRRVGLEVGGASFYWFNKNFQKLDMASLSTPTL